MAEERIAEKPEDGAFVYVSVIRKHIMSLLMGVG